MEMQDTTTAVKKSPLITLAEWSVNLPLWQQDALRRIVESGSISTTDVDELSSLCLKENGIEVESDLAAVPFNSSHIPAGSAAGERVAIKSIAEVENANALDSQQELTFGETGLTVVFGYNGSGKSGYGRILRRSCRARSKGEPILPNVTVDSDAASASAVFSYSLDSVTQDPEQWVDGLKPVDSLGSVSFFDADCAHSHVRNPNDIAFTPLGLDVLPKLGAACKQVQERINAEKKRLVSERPTFLAAKFATGSNSVGKYLSKLTKDSDLNKLDLLVNLSEGELKRLKDIPTLLGRDPKKQAAEVRKRANRIEAVHKRLGQSLTVLSDASKEKLETLAKDASAKKLATDAAAKLGFADDPLSDIGGQAWRTLWDAARKYSSVARPDQEFPIDDSDVGVCVLCQQDLAPTAQDRLKRFEAFVADTTAKEAKQAADLFAIELKKVTGFAVSDEAIRENVQDIEAPELRKLVLDAVTSLEKRQGDFAGAAKSGNWTVGSLPGCKPVLDSLSQEFSKLRETAAELEKSADQKERDKLQTELTELQSREWLATVAGDVKIHMFRLLKIGILQMCVNQTKTNAITAKSKSMAKEFVTDKLRGAFADEIKKMRQGTRRLNVELVATAGEFGSSHYRVRLVGASNAEVGKVVSEGEHRCIALAGFLSELITENSGSAIVFDDPVTSLDHHWRGCFATRLVEEAVNRQVIVFTHDIVFLHDLLEGAKRSQADLQVRRLRAGRDTCGMVDEDLPWIAKKTLERLDALEKEARRTRADFDNQHDDIYERDIYRVYSDLRATVEKSVEEIFFRGVVLRHRDYINLSNLKYVAAMQATDCAAIQNLHQRCCDITEAHDRAALRNFGVPTPDQALADMALLRTSIDQIKQSHKNVV
jgi:energy-coupling factor transporter ATP-binding protein EcfA2